MNLQAPAAAELITGKTIAELAKQANLSWQIAPGLDATTSKIIEVLGNDSMALQKSLLSNKLETLESNIQQILNEVITVRGSTMTKKEYFKSLMFDPDKGKITVGSIDEALAALNAENQGLLKGPLLRGSNGSDYIDIFNIPWDVKKAISRIPKGTMHIFNAEQFITNIKFEMMLGENIIIDAAPLEPADMLILVKEIKAKMNPDEIGRIIIACKD